MKPTRGRHGFHINKPCGGQCKDLFQGLRLNGHWFICSHLWSNLTSPARVYGTCPAPGKRGFSVTLKQSSLITKSMANTQTLIMGLNSHTLTLFLRPNIFSNWIPSLFFFFIANDWFLLKWQSKSQVIMGPQSIDLKEHEWPLYQPGLICEQKKPMDVFFGLSGGCRVF